jgi:serine/threonine protein kinase
MAALNISIPSPERRMVLNRYVDPEFGKILEDKSINQLVKNEAKLSNNMSGASSSASIYKLPDGKMYIVRKTPGGIQRGLRLKREMEMYKLLKSKPEYVNFISNLLYADAHLAAGTKKSYFVFEYEEGDTLDQFIKKHRVSMTTAQIMGIYNHLQNAISFLESNGVVHRDIKPENVYFSYERGIPLLFDFDAGCVDRECLSVEFTGSPKYSTPGSKTIRGQEGFTVNTKVYKYSPLFDRYSVAVILKEDLIDLARPEDKKEIEDIGKAEVAKYLSQNDALQIKKGGNRMKNRTRKNIRGGSDCRVGVGFPKFGGKSKPQNTFNSLVNFSESLISGGGCPCAASAENTALIKPMMALPEGVTQGPLTRNLMNGGGCGCKEVPKLPTPLQGGYRATKRNLKYLKRWKQGKSIGFTMRSSLKAKGLIPRADGKKRVSPKYRK